MTEHEEPNQDPERDLVPLQAEREGEVVRLHGTTSDLEALGQSAAAAAADPEVTQVDVADAVMEQPDSGLWH